MSFLHKKKDDSSKSKKIVDSPPRTHHFDSVDARVKSFNTRSFAPYQWSTSLLPSPELMAEAGFYFTPNEKNSDCCTCYKCGIKMFNWLPADNPRIEHKKFSPHCKEVKTWNLSYTEEHDAPLSTSRAEQTDSTLKLVTGRAKKLFDDLLHIKRQDSPPMSHKQVTKNNSQESFVPPPIRPSTSSILTPQENLTEIRKQRNIAEKSLEGLIKLCTYFPNGSEEQARTKDTIKQQQVLIEQLKEEEHRLENALPTYHEAVNSPVNAGSFQTQAVQNNYDDINDQMRILSLSTSSSNSNNNSLDESQNDNNNFDNNAFDFNKQELIDDEWVEYKTPEGYPYYYSIKSKESVWCLPTNLNNINANNFPGSPSGKKSV